MFEYINTYFYIYSDKLFRYFIPTIPMNGITKQKVKASGFKYNHLAKQIKVHPQYFSMVMRGERFLSPLKEQILNEILKDVIVPVKEVV